MKLEIKTPFDIKRCGPAVANEKPEGGHSKEIARLLSCLSQNTAEKRLMNTDRKYEKY